MGHTTAKHLAHIFMGKILSLFLRKVIANSCKSKNRLPYWAFWVHLCRDTEKNNVVSKVHKFLQVEKVWSMAGWAKFFFQPRDNWIWRIWLLRGIKNISTFWSVRRSLVTMQGKIARLFLSTQLFRSKSVNWHYNKYLIIFVPWENN